MWNEVFRSWSWQRRGGCIWGQAQRSTWLLLGSPTSAPLLDSRWQCAPSALRWDQYPLHAGSLCSHIHAAHSCFFPGTSLLVQAGFLNPLLRRTASAKTSLRRAPSSLFIEHGKVFQRRKVSIHRSISFLSPVIVKMSLQCDLWCFLTGPMITCLNAIPELWCKKSRPWWVVLTSRFLSLQEWETKASAWQQTSNQLLHHQTPTLWPGGPTLLKIQI